MATNEDDTQLAITDDADTSVVPDSSADIPELLAWSAEQPEAPHEESPWPDRLRWLALISLVVTTTSATVWLATVFYQGHWAAPIVATAPTKVVASAPSSKQDAPPPAALPAPGPPVQHEKAPSPPPEVASPPPAATRPPPLPDPPAHAYDTYVQLLARDGIISMNSPQEMHDRAYWVCSAVSTGDTTRLNTIIVESQLGDALTPAQIRIMLTHVVDAYCPQYRSLLN